MKVPKYNHRDMDRNARNSLKEALNLVRAGDYDRARPILIELLKAHPDAEQAWFLLSYTLPERNRQVYALQQALAANPDYERARERLARLRGEAADDEEPATPAFEELPPEPIPTPAFLADEGEEDFGNGDLSAEFEEEPRPPRPGWRIVLSIVIFVLLVTAGYLLTGDWLAQQLAGSGASRPAAPTATATVAFRELPPTWTPTPGQPTATPAPDEAPTLTPASEELTLGFPAPGGETIGRMEAIEEQVLALRGLTELTQSERYIISSAEALNLLGNQYLNDQAAQEIERQAMALVALGLIPADYSLADYALSSRADQAGGFYVPDYQSIFLIGADFSGLAPFVYAHEYAHALADQHFDLTDLVPEEGCLLLSDDCRAALALVEGDATYLGAQWLSNFAEAELLEAALDYPRDEMLVQTQPPPPFVPLDLAFPYEFGAVFVESLVDLGGWERVDEAFGQPPSTTEQILHPEKYAADEGALPLEAVDLAPALSTDWQPLLQGSLGEWLTYMILSQGVEEAARLADDPASEAAAGWGGDRVQTYSRADGSVLLAAHYIWDSEADADEWLTAMQQHLEARLAVDATDELGGACWRAQGLAACVLAAGEQTLWLQGPDLDLLGDVLALYTAFQ